MAISTLTDQSYFDPREPFPGAYTTPYAPPSPETIGTVLGSSATDPTYQNFQPPPPEVLGASTAPSEPSVPSEPDWGTIYREKYPGWGEPEARADYLATGGPQPSAPAEPSPTDTFLGQYPGSDIESFMDQYANPDEFYKEIESVYGAKSDLLNQAEEAVRTGQVDILTGLAADVTAAKAQADVGKKGALGELGTAETTATRRKEDALAAARRLYSELRMGGQQRFGGSTSAGGAMSELLGVEQQRQMGQTQRDFSSTMQQIQTQKVDIERNYQAQLQQLNADKTNAMSLATQEFQNRLLTISTDRVQAEEAKAQARLGVLQNLRDTAAQIQQQHLQFQQQLEMMKQQQTMDLENYAQQLQMSAGAGQQATSQFAGSTTTTPSTKMTFQGQAGTLGTGIQSAQGQIAGFNQADFEEQYGLSPVQAYTQANL